MLNSKISLLNFKIFLKNTVLKESNLINNLPIINRRCIKLQNYKTEEKLQNHLKKNHKILTPPYTDNHKKEI